MIKALLHKETGYLYLKYMKNIFSVLECDDKFYLDWDNKDFSNALATHEFNSEQSCIMAGKEATKLANGTVKEIKFVCVKK